MKVTIIGSFGIGKNFLDGQTVKTKSVAKAIEDYIEDAVLTKYDTCGNRLTSLLKAPVICYKALKSSENIVVLLAKNGLRVYAPILALLNYFLNKKLHYVVIGGWLSDFINRRQALKFCLKKFHGIYVETNGMKEQLQKQEFKNIYVMPNFKEIQIVEPDELIKKFEEPYSLCTFSRVSEAKGIGIAVEAVKKINTQLGHEVFRLDIYGQIDKDQVGWFNRLKAEFPSYIQYKGLVEYSESTSVLKSYYALLFPTHYSGEGFPGTLIDAISAGVPVIASDWKFNKEIIQDNKTGIILSLCDVDSMVNALNEIVDNEKWIEMRSYCVYDAKTFLPKNVIKVLGEHLNYDEK